MNDILHETEAAADLVKTLGHHLKLLKVCVGSYRSLVLAGATSESIAAARQASGDAALACRATLDKITAALGNSDHAE